MPLLHNSRKSKGVKYANIRNNPLPGMQQAVGRYVRASTDTMPEMQGTRRNRHREKKNINKTERQKIERQQSSNSVVGVFIFTERTVQTQKGRETLNRKIKWQRSPKSQGDRKLRIYDTRRKARGT